MTATYRYFRIIERPPADGRKLPTYLIRSRSTAVVLGEIRWYGPWRQYCFWPVKYAETIWSLGCLRDIEDFMEKLEQERKQLRTG